MNQQHSTESTPFVRRYQYPDHTTIVADLGSATEPSVDIVDSTAIIVTRDTQHEIDLPEPAADVKAVNKNGIVTITVNQ